MDAFRRRQIRAVTLHHWDDRPRATPTGQARAAFRRETREEIAAAVQDAAPEPDPMPWEVVPAWAFRCPCGDSDCDGLA